MKLEDQRWMEFQRRMDLTTATHDPARRDADQRTAASWFAEIRANDRAAESERERTAATILAALTRERMVPNTETDDEKATLDDLDRDCVRYSVALADALRAELGKTGGGGK